MLFLDKGLHSVAQDRMHKKCYSYITISLQIIASGIYESSHWLYTAIGGSLGHLKHHDSPENSFTSYTSDCSHTWWL